MDPRPQEQKVDSKQGNLRKEKRSRIVFDVDGTLITLKNKPNYPVIDMFRMFQKLGWDMNIHSGSGVDYARMWKEKLGLMASVKMKGDPNEEYDIAVDDSLDEYDWTHIKHKNYIKAKVFITI